MVLECAKSLATKFKGRKTLRDTTKELSLIRKCNIILSIAAYPLPQIQMAIHLWMNKRWQLEKLMTASASRIITKILLYENILENMCCKYSSYFVRNFRSVTENEKKNRILQ